MPPPGPPTPAFTRRWTPLPCSEGGRRGTGRSPFLTSQCLRGSPVPAPRPGLLRGRTAASCAGSTVLRALIQPEWQMERGCGHLVTHVQKQGREVERPAQLELGVPLNLLLVSLARTVGRVRRRLERRGGGGQVSQPPLPKRAQTETRGAAGPAPASLHLRFLISPSQRLL